MLSANFWLIVLSLHTGPKVRTASPADIGFSFALLCILGNAHTPSSSLLQPFVAQIYLIAELEHKLFWFKMDRA